MAARLPDRHLAQLPTSRNQFAQSPRLSTLERLRSRPYRRAETGDHFGVYAIGPGQAAHGPRKATNIWIRTFDSLRALVLPDNLLANGGVSHGAARGNISAEEQRTAYEIICAFID